MSDIHKHWMDDPAYDVADDYQEVLSGWTKFLMSLVVAVAALFYWVTR